jgi:hypothetical protein
MEAPGRATRAASRVPTLGTVDLATIAGMTTRAAWGVFAVVLLSGCGDDSVTRTSDLSKVRVPARDDAVDRTSDQLAEFLPRALTAEDVENVLTFTPIVEAGDENAASAEFRRRHVDESEYRTVAARVSMAYAQLLMADDADWRPPRAKQLLADIEVVRPFRGRLDAMHEARRAREEAAVDRSGKTVTLTRPAFLFARREKPEAWEPFEEPATKRAGFRVKAGAGEQVLVVRSQGDLSGTTTRYALQPGGSYVEDAEGIVIRPTGAGAK